MCNINFVQLLQPIFLVLCRRDTLLTCAPAIVRLDLVAQRSQHFRMLFHRGRKALRSCQLVVLHRVSGGLVSYAAPATSWSNNDTRSRGLQMCWYILRSQSSLILTIVACSCECVAYNRRDNHDGHDNPEIAAMCRLRVR